MNEMIENQKSDREQTGLSQETIRIRSVPEFQGFDVSEEAFQAINAIAPKPLTPDNVYVRSMFLCSSEGCDTDGCRFTKKALDQIATLIVGQSVMTGHDRSSLPVARFYKASVVQQNEIGSMEPVYLVRAWFYWLRDTSGAKDLLLNIDGGIYREVSLAWRYRSWTCSVCGEPNGRCAHRPGEMYGDIKCFRLIDEVLDVMEGSLVYKSADRNTYLTGARFDAVDSDENRVVLICVPGDPIFERLQSYGVVEDVVALSENEDFFSEAIDDLWVRQTEELPVRVNWRRMLSPGGRCLMETRDSGNQLFGTFEEYINTSGDE